eukprot:515754_1
MGNAAAQQSSASKINSEFPAKNENKADKISFEANESQNQTKRMLYDTTDSNNTKILKEISNWSNQKGLGIDSSYLLRVNKQKNTCDSSECLHLKHLQLLLTRYHETNNSNNTISAHNICCDDYRQAWLLDDFHHLLSDHEGQFEEIHCHLVHKTNHRKQCCLLTCSMMRRYNRNRDPYSETQFAVNTIYPHCNNIKDIVLSQILDKIHCYYFHSFDVGHRLSTNDVTKIQNSLNDNKEHKQISDGTYDAVIKTITQHIQSKKYCSRKLFSLSRSYDKEHKQISDGTYDAVIKTITQHIQSKKYCSRKLFSLSRSYERFNTKTTNNEIKYRNGFRFFYWQFYRNNVEYVDLATSRSIEHANDGYTLGQCYVVSKHINLKKELLHNTICSLNQTQWYCLVEAANLHLLSYHIKQLTCHRADKEKYFNIKKDDGINLDHLIAMMVYCNYDTLQNLFSATFRRTTDAEHIQSLISRHSHYAHMARLLREVVECFGTQHIQTIFWHKQMYHGLSEEAQFPSADICIKGPVSTSSDYCVALNFSGNHGMILEFSLGFQWMDIWNYSFAMFDCQFISDYPGEQEIFFIGGYSHFNLRTIIRSDGTNYNLYLSALIMLSDIFNHHCACGEASLTDETILHVMMFRILSHELSRYYPNDKRYHKLSSMSLYLQQLVQNHFAKWENFCLDWMFFNKDLKEGPQSTGFFGKLIKAFFFYDYGWLKLDLLVTVFPR